jgi:hypothetical protein
VSAQSKPAIFFSRFDRFAPVMKDSIRVVGKPANA